MGWWIALGIVVLLAILPLGVSVRYDSDGVVLRILAGPIRYTLLPKKKKDKLKKEKKPQKEKKQPEPKPEPAPAEEPAPPRQSKPTEPPKEKKGGNILDFLPLVDVALGLLGELLGRTLHVDVLYLKLTLGGDDPCDLATNYGKACAALGNLWPRLEEWLTIKKRDVQLQCDFTSNETFVNARVDITITLGRLISLLVRHGIRALKVYLKIRKKQKGGASV